MNFEVGDRVRYIGCTQEQINWGNNDRPYMCIIDHIYTVSNVEVHTSHTKIELKGIIGRTSSRA